MRVLVCGSRDWGWENRHVIEDRLRQLLGQHGHGLVIVHGACSRPVTVAGRVYEQSADMLADAAAKHLGLAVEPHPANWKLGRRAGPIRTNQMFDSGIDLVEAFQRGNSPGTAHAIREAKRRGIPVEEHHQ